jgi:hypothetical protein
VSAPASSVLGERSGEDLLLGDLVGALLAHAEEVGDLEESDRLGHYPPFFGDMSITSAPSALTIRPQSPRPLGTLSSTLDPVVDVGDTRLPVERPSAL